MGEVYSHLSEEERQVIQIEIGNGTSIRAIGAMLGRNASSISREIRRNTWFPSNENESYRPYRPKRLKTGPWTGRYYIAGPAQRKADRRRARPRKPYRLSCDRLWARVAEWLGRGWSPLLISGRLRVLWPDDPRMRVCPETIYRWIYSSKPLRERWARCLPRGHKRRRKRGGRRASRFPIPERVSISERPQAANDRSGFGHWEADSVIGVGCNLHTEVERRTRFLMALIVPDKTAGESAGAQMAMFGPLPAGARVSVTHDNGAEFAPPAPERRTGHGRLLRRPVQLLAAGKQREPLFMFNVLWVGVAWCFPLDVQLVFRRIVILWRREETWVRSAC